MVASFGLLDVGDVEVDGVALLDADDVGCEVAAHRGHPDVDAVVPALDAFLATLDRERIVRSCVTAFMPAGL